MRPRRAPSGQNVRTKPRSLRESACHAGATSCLISPNGGEEAQREPWSGGPRMGDHRGRRESKAAEELILRTIAAHAGSLLRTARRHSMCADDAQDAYQRGLEIFVHHAHRLDPGRANAWLHTVVKHEAQALRRSREKLVGSEAVDFDNHEARHLPTSEEQLLSFDMVSRSAEALQRLKPQELRALWLKAQGHSYNDIGSITGWSYTKVNRCIAEGRQSFLERYAGIESGDECDRWMPVLSAMVDGEATQDQILEMRPHLRNCPGCRGRLKAMRDSSDRLAAVLPLPLVAATLGATEPMSNVALRIYEAVAGGLHERAAHSVTKLQAMLEVSSAGKVAAVAASAAAVAGGGYTSLEHATRNVAQAVPAQSRIHRGAADPRRRTHAVGQPVPLVRASPRPPAGRASPTDHKGYSPSLVRRARQAPEFADADSRGRERRGEPSGATTRASRLEPVPSNPSPEFGTASSSLRAEEFGP